MPIHAIIPEVKKKKSPQETDNLNSFKSSFAIVKHK